MAVSLKPLDQQVIVITGATSGIGLTTARLASKAGAALVLAARSEQDLAQLEKELSQEGGRVAYVAADVGKSEDVRRIAEKAITAFGGFDTWVNNAGVSIWGRVEQASDEDNRRLFDTDFWGVVYGSEEAAKHLRHRGGGAIINLGSLASDRAFPLQGMYCAAKHAVKGFTDTLRMELEEEDAPVCVTLIKPAGIDTPFVAHAKNYMKEEPKLPPPVYTPEEVARAILHAATHPTRDLFVGSVSKVLSAAGRYAPRLTDRFMENMMFDQQKQEQPAQHSEGALHGAGGGLNQRGEHPGMVRHASYYTRASMHPWMTAMLVGAASAAVVGLIEAGREYRQA